MISKAVTVTVHDPQKDFEDWCAHHQKHFDLLLVWIDDPAHIDRVRHLGGGGLKIAAGSEIAHPSRLTQTLLRQEANATAANQICVQHSVTWLLHVDCDELFVSQDESLWGQSAGQITFPNHEACCKWTVEHPFRDIRYFKKNGQLPFLLYQGGKSAVRCASGVRADGPHRFANHAGQTVVSKDSFILHYACVSFERWLQKYLHLGEFSDWYKDDFRTPIGLDFHVGSRNVVQSFVETGDLDRCREFFSQAVWKDQQIRDLIADEKILAIAPGELFGFDQ